MKTQTRFCSKNASLSLVTFLAIDKWGPPGTVGEVTVWSPKIHLTSSGVTWSMHLRKRNHGRMGFGAVGGSLVCSVKRGAQACGPQPSSWIPACPVCQESSRWAVWIPVALAMFLFRMSPYFIQDVRGWKFDRGGLSFSSRCFVVLWTTGSLSPSCPFAQLFSWGWQS